MWESKVASTIDLKLNASEVQKLKSTTDVSLFSHLTHLVALEELDPYSLKKVMAQKIILTVLYKIYLGPEQPICCLVALFHVTHLNIKPNISAKKKFFGKGWLNRQNRVNP